MRKESREAVSLWTLAFVVIAACLLLFAKPVKANSYADATVLPIDGKWMNNYTAPLDSQGATWFRVDIPSDGQLIIKNMNFGSSSGTVASLTGTLYSSDLTRTYSIPSSNGVTGAGSVNGGTQASPVAEQSVMAISSGTYYFKYNVANNLDGATDVVFSTYVKFTPYGINDQNALSYTSPQDYSSGQTIVGALTEMKSTDWFRFKVSGNRQYQMTFSGEAETSIWGGSFDFELYNDDLTETIGATSLATEENTLKSTTYSFSLSDGEYYIKLYTDSRSDHCKGKYSFTINDVTPTPQPETPSMPSVTPVAPSVPSTPSVTDTTSKEVSAFKAAARKIKVKVSPKKKKAKVSWKKISGASGYQIRYSKKKSMKGSKTVRVAGASKKSKVIKKLAAKKKYYFQVRAYKVINGQTYYGTWSSKKAVKIKK